MGHRSQGHAPGKGVMKMGAIYGKEIKIHDYIDQFKGKMIICLEPVYLPKTGAPFGFQVIRLYTRWWQLIDFLFLPRNLGKMIQVDEHIFSDGLVQPPVKSMVEL